MIQSVLVSNYCHKRIWKNTFVMLIRVTPCQSCCKKIYFFRILLSKSSHISNSAEWKQTSGFTSIVQGKGTIIWSAVMIRDVYRGLVLAPIWVGTRVPPRFWATGLLSVFFIFLNNLFFDDFFYNFLTWMVSERLPNRNDNKPNNKLRDLTSQKRNRVRLLQRCSL